MGFDRIVENGYCIGCGACATNPNSGIIITFDEHGRYQAAASKPFAKQSDRRELDVCPFSDESQSEDQIGTRLFFGAPHDSRIGFFRSLYVGYVAEGKIREKATSGGLITWLLSELLATNKIDGVIHVKKVESAGSDCLFEYAISRDAASVLAGAKSRYYPVEASKVLRYVRENPGRYAFVGIPCFIKAVRNLMLEEPVFAERIKYCIGIVCGHLKSKAFADCFAWQVGITPGALESIDFRVKRDEGAAGDYAVHLKGDRIDITKRTQEFLGANWGHNFFRYEACDYCDDVLAETADISVGDAWLPEYENDPKGTSIVVVRSEELAELISAAKQDGRLHLDPATADSIAMSQAGGLRDRREGLAYRLHLKKKAGKWVPGKRVEPCNKGLPMHRKKIYAHRSYMGKMSHIYWREAVQRKSLAFFEENMNRLIQKNNQLYRPFWMRVKNKLKHILGI
jgi:coenzyme F420-reducing hydrogenase beta subunit